MKHQPNPEEPERCLASDLLVVDCSGCRGSDESFVDALLASEKEPPGRKAEVELPLGYVDPDPREEEQDRPGPPRERYKGERWWLNTGKPTQVVPDSRAFTSSYSGSFCRCCDHEIKERQLIQHVNIGGYAHVRCLEAQ